MRPSQRLGEPEARRLEDHRRTDSGADWGQQSCLWLTAGPPWFPEQAGCG